MEAIPEVAKKAIQQELDELKANEKDMPPRPVKASKTPSKATPKRRMSVEDGAGAGAGQEPEAEAEDAVVVGDDEDEDEDEEEQPPAKKQKRKGKKKK
jgi:hypothetical protein